MRRILTSLVLMTSMLGGVGCHTCDVCDDCGDAPIEGSEAGCATCGSHAVVKPMTPSVAAKPTKMIEHK